MYSRRFVLRATVATSVAACLPSPAWAEVRSGELDRRNASTNIDYRLIFTARGSGGLIDFPGHAYMMTGEYDNVGKVCRFDRNNIFGFYPDGEPKLLKFAWKLPGFVGTRVKEDLDHNLITHRLDIRVAQNGFDAAAAVARKYAQENPYHLADNDCVTFVVALLTAVEEATRGAASTLNVPNRATLQTPRQYLSALMNENGVKL